MDHARELVHRYLDEIATPAEFAELGRLLPLRPGLADMLAGFSRNEIILETRLRECRAQTAITATLAIHAPEPALAIRPLHTVRRGFVQWKWCAAALLLVATGMLFGFWVNGPGARAGTVISGRVIVDGVEVAQVPDDSLLEVAGEDSAVIRLPDGSQAELAPDSAAVLRRQGWGRRKVVELDRGRATFWVGKGGKQFRVDTPLGSISGRDAEFRVELQPSEEPEEGEDNLNNRTSVLLVVAALFGQVEVYSGGQHYVLAAGEMKEFADKPAKNSKKPSFGGKVVEVSSGTITVEAGPNKKGSTPERKQFKLTDKTEYVYQGVSKDDQKPTVGYQANVWLQDDSPDTAARVLFLVKQVVRDGVVGSVSADGKSFTLQVQGKDGKTADVTVKISEGAKLVYRDADKGDKPSTGYFARVWLKPGNQDIASGVVFSSKKITDDSGGKGSKKPSPDGKKPTADGKKAPSVAGTVKALAADGKTFTLTTPPNKKTGESSTIEIRIGDQTKISAGKDEAKLAVGQFVVVWLEKDTANVAKAVQIGAPKKPGKPGKPDEPEKPKPNKPGKKPVPDDNKPAPDGKKPPTDGKKPVPDVQKPTDAKKPAEDGKKPPADAKKPLPEGEKPAPDGKKPPADGKKPFPDGKKSPAFAGTVKAISADGKTFTLTTLPNKKTGESTTLDIRISDDTKITTGNDAAKLAAGQVVVVWLEKGSENLAKVVQVGQPKKQGKPDQPEKPKPAPDGKKPPADGKKPASDGKKPAANDENQKKPDEPKKPAKPPRDSAPTAALIDAEIERHLAAVKVSSSPLADDATFLRRVSLDLTGRIPTYSRTLAFLESKDPDKRNKLVDELLESRGYGQHLATIWRNLIVPRNDGSAKGATRDTFSDWLAEQFNDDRGWDAIVRDMLLAEGPIKDTPQSAFLMANGEEFRPKANVIAGSVARLFWGVNLRCAECHNHPFANWKQDDFWGTAAFFGKLQFTGFKNGASPALVESDAIPVAVKGKKGNQDAAIPRGSAIEIPADAGKAAGRIVKARFLRGDEPALDEKEPFRPAFAAWATAADNPWFARAAVNRTWAHFFGRGLINPLDATDTGTPSHPELLRRLASEFVSSGFDLKHLARCIVNSKSYQRGSEPIPGNEADTAGFSRMSVKVLTPEVIFDSLAIVCVGDKNFVPAKAGVKGTKSAGKGTKSYTMPEQSRAQFARFFRTGEDADPTEYTQGIPQLLRLMNGPMLNGEAAVIDRLIASEVTREEAITTLYLTTLSRRPRESEIKLLSEYLSRREDAREGYTGALWILLNSSEFALNR
jgi:ferric-dicitrate binding protein FerR (iron transport regulator)